MSDYQLSQRSKLNREGIDSRLIEISNLAITLTLIDFGHGSVAGKRSPEVQNKLFHEGKSKCDGYDEISNHQTGRALDFYAYVDGAASWKQEHLAMVAAAFLQAAAILGYKLAWGGLWKSSKSDLYGWDMPHVELVD